MTPSTSSTPHINGSRHSSQSSATPTAPGGRSAAAPGPATRSRGIPRRRRLATNRAIDAPAATKNITAAASVTVNARQPGSTARASPVVQSMRWCTSMATRATPRSRSSGVGPRRPRRPRRLAGCGQRDAGGARKDQRVGADTAPYPAGGTPTRGAGGDGTGRARAPAGAGARGRIWPVRPDWSGRQLEAPWAWSQSRSSPAAIWPAPTPSRAANGPHGCGHDPHVDHRDGVVGQAERARPALLVGRRHVGRPARRSVSPA